MNGVSCAFYKNLEFISEGANYTKWNGIEEEKNYIYDTIDIINTVSSKYRNIRPLKDMVQSFENFISNKYVSLLEKKVTYPDPEVQNPEFQTFLYKYFGPLTNINSFTFLANKASLNITSNDFFQYVNKIAFEMQERKNKIQESYKKGIEILNTLKDIVKKIDLIYQTKLSKYHSFSQSICKIYQYLSYVLISVLSLLVIIGIFFSFLNLRYDTIFFYIILNICFILTFVYFMIGLIFMVLSKQSRDYSGLIQYSITDQNLNSTFPFLFESKEALIINECINKGGNLAKIMGFQPDEILKKIYSEGERFLISKKEDFESLNLMFCNEIESPLYMCEVLEKNLFFFDSNVIFSSILEKLNNFTRVKKEIDQQIVIEPDDYWCLQKNECPFDYIYHSPKEAKKNEKNCLILFEWDEKEVTKRYQGITISSNKYSSVNQVIKEYNNTIVKYINQVNEIIQFMRNAELHFLEKLYEINNMTELSYNFLIELNKNLETLYPQDNERNIFTIFTCCKILYLINFYR